MPRLFRFVYGMAGPTLAGVCAVVWLLVPQIAAHAHILGAAGFGAAAAVPASWAIARRMDGPGGT